MTVQDGRRPTEVLRRPTRARADGLLVCAPMWVESQALRRSLPAGAVRRTGYGVRSRQRAGLVTDSGARAVVVAGLAGSARADVRPGDVVVATEVVDDPDLGGSRVSCPTAPLLAAALRDQGLRVHLGPVHTARQVTSGAAAERLAATGAIAVDLESAPLAAAAGDRTVGVVRVVVDSPARPLWRPDLPARGALALARLSQAGRGIAEWSASVRPHEVLLASPRSFCAGVERAIEVVERALELRGAPVYVRKQIVHNAHVVRSLEERGAVFVDELAAVPPGSTVVLSAHGVAPVVHEQAASRGLDVIDATCPLVAKVHAEARRHDRRGRTVVLIGHDGHEETVGTLGELDGRGVLVQDVVDVASMEVPDPDRVSYLMQTTLAVDESAEIVAALRERFPRLTGPDTDDICYATSNRQQALVEVAERADVVLVVGSANSSNSRRLVEVAQRHGAAAHLVEDVHQVRPTWLAGADVVGVSAGASAPPALVDELVDVLHALGGGPVHEHRTATESITFTLPKEVNS